MAATVCPGDRLGRQDEYVPGPGTHERNGVIYASILGTQHTRPADQGEALQGSTRHIVEVVPAGNVSRVPQPGDLVTVKVTRVGANSANCLILCLGKHALTAEFRGLIRQQDVRATEIDKVVMYDSFRPGDIVRCEVLSLGDARSVYLTTAKDHLGVVYAKSVAGYQMTPVDWTTMVCPETEGQEKRKVAKAVKQEVSHS